ncbi:MAG TPA: hypothetical protein VNX67_06445 [Solirubrobacteraceae bacterium]|jgi:hypothetical protein|nr:hypothetical protein [Solirubrobacteraceae bacterium]
MTKRVTIIGLAFAASWASCFAVVASAAGAEYIYKVNKASLETGKTKEVRAKAKTSQVMGGEFLGTKFRVICNKLKLVAAEKPVIKGGVPGRSEKERFAFEECETTICDKKVTVEAGSLENEIVTVVQPATKAGKLAVEYKGTGGSNLFAKIQLTCIGILVTAEIQGTTVWLDSPEKMEQRIGTLIGKTGAEEITEVEKSAGTKEKVGLKCEGKPVTFEGESEIELVSEENWGIF